MAAILRMVDGMRGTRAFTISRAGTLDPNVRVIEQRAQSFSSSQAVKAGAALVVTRSEAGLRSFVLTDDLTGVDKQVLALAQAVAGRLESADDTPDLTAAPVVGRLTYRTTDASAHQTQAGLDLAEMSRQLANVMPDGAWVALAVRTPSKAEVRRWSRWLTFRMNTARPQHHSMSTHAVIASIWAGGASRSDVSMILDTVRANLPGFDLDAVPTFPSRGLEQAIPAVLGLIVLAATLFSNLPIPTVAGVGAAVLGLLAAVGVHTGVIPTTDSRLRAALTAGVLPVPPARLLPPAAPRRATTKRDNDGNVIDVPEREGAYPLHPATFKLGPALLAATVAPHAGAASGSQTTAVRPTPPRMTERIGPLFGTGGDGLPVHLSAVNIDSTVSLVGAAGSGKSSAVRHLAAWYMLERTRPCGDPTFPGAKNTLVVFMPKPDDANKVGAWAAALGDRMRLVEVAAPTGFAIDLFGVPGTIKDKALHVVSAMRYAFGADSIGVESQRSLTWVLTAAQAVTDQVAATAGLPTGKSVMFYAYILLAGQGDEKAVALAKAIETCLSSAQAALAKAHRDGDPAPVTDTVTNLELAHAELQVMFGAKTTPSQRAAFQKAPGNKVYALMNLEHWWSPARRKFSWEDVVTGHRAVLVMTGTTLAGDRMEAETEQAMASMLMFSLRDAIERRCAGWADQNRWVTIIADELSDLAGTSPEVLSWARDRGRSYGVRLVFATQRPGQLPPDVRTAFMSFSTLVAFKQDTGPVAAEIAADLAADGSDWTAADVLNLPEHHAIVRANVNFNRMSPFVVKPLFLEDDMTAFPATMGYPPYVTVTAA